MTLRQLNASVLSPLLLFPAAWAFAALLSQFHLLNGQGPWSTVMVAVVVAVPLAFVAGGLIGEGLALRLTGANVQSPEPAASTRVFRTILIAFVLLGLAELAHQFVKIGGVPLLSPQGNSLRFEQGGPTIVLTDLLTVAAIAALAKPQNLLARESRFELLVAIVALGGFALQAGRGSIVLPVVVATAARWLYRGRPRTPMLAAAALVGFAAVVFGFYLRARQHPFNPFEAELYGEILPDMPFFLQPLVPIYLGITTNFLALQGVVGNFPTGAPFGGGAFDAIGLDLIFTGARNISDVSAGLTPPWVTSTVAGALWADGGFGTLVPGVAITGFLSAGAFAMAVRTRTFRWSMAAAYLLYLAVFGLYTNLWTQQVDWLLIVPLLLIVGAVVEDPAAPPGLTGRAWARIARMRERDRRQPPADAPDSGGKHERGLTRGLVVSGLAIIALLIVSGLAIQRLLPEPFPRIVSVRLPNAVARSAAVMTNSNRPEDNERLLWVKRRGSSVGLYSYKPGRPPGETSLLTRIAAPRNLRNTSFDVGYWPPWRALALFSFEQRPSWLWVKVSPTRSPDGGPVTFRVPISAPVEGATRDLMIATWEGIKPDLFVLTRGNPESRALLQILSGESSFRRQLLAIRLPYRGLSPRIWSVDIGPIATLPSESPERSARGTRTDLMLVRHDPDKKRSDVQILLGETDFQWNAFQRDLDDSGSVPSGTDFLIGSHAGATTVYEMRRHGGMGARLQVFGLTNLPQLR